MDVFDILRRDHEESLRRFRLLKKTTPQESDKREREFVILLRDLLAHVQAEESTFYQPLMQSKYREDALEALEEHRVIELMLQDLRATAPDTERWRPKLSVLKEMLEHHIGEEEGKIFDEMRVILSPGIAEEIGRQFSAKKNELLAKIS